MVRFAWDKRWKCGNAVHGFLGKRYSPDSKFKAPVVEVTWHNTLRWPLPITIGASPSSSDDSISDPIEWTIAGSLLGSAWNKNSKLLFYYVRQHDDQATPWCTRLNDILRRDSRLRRQRARHVSAEKLEEAHISQAHSHVRGFFTQGLPPYDARRRGVVTPYDIVQQLKRRYEPVGVPGAVVHSTCEDPC